MNVIYFFIILCLVNIAMFLLITQCLQYYKNKSPEFKGVIMVVAVVLFTLIAALIYAGMIGWNTEHFYPHWNLENGFQVSPIRKQCMAEQVCMASDKGGNCVPYQEQGLNTINFPPKYTGNCIGNGDCKDEPYGSGCHKWTVGWNGSFPMNYNAWINPQDHSTPFGWPRTDATGSKIKNVPPTTSCAPSQVPCAPSIPFTPQPDAYSTLNQYNIRPMLNPNILPKPGGSVKELYTPQFMHCTPPPPTPPSCHQFRENYKSPIEELDVIFYGSSGCGFCTKSKEMFKKAGVKVTYKDSRKHSKEMRENGGGGGVPHFYSLKTKKSHTGYPGTVEKLVEKLN